MEKQRIGVKVRNDEMAKELFKLLIERNPTLVYRDYTARQYCNEVHFDWAESPKSGHLWAQYLLGYKITLIGLSG